MSELLERLERRDASLWPEGNVSPNRLGWLDVAQRMEAESPDLRRWADSIDASNVVILGMGGSSLGPLVLANAARVAGLGGGRNVVVCDTTDPSTVAAMPTSDTLFLVSSKSGGTLEPNALFAHAWSKVPDGSRFVAITDPGTSLDRLATERGFARIFRNPPDIGGRYSVLSYFGMVPAALCGYDPAELARAAEEVDKEEAVSLGQAMGEAAEVGHDKVTIRVPKAYASFGSWVEQLIAESTGKMGRGCIPVPTTIEEHGDDRFHVSVDIPSPTALAAEFHRWEIATAIAGHVLGIDPFDEPNVAESKANTAQVLSSLPLPKLAVNPVCDMWGWLAENVGDGDYVSLQAYLPLGDGSELESARSAVSAHLGGVATTAGYGPRFLHSTGQLHKGGPNTVVAVQIVPKGGWGSLPIPGQPYDFGTLIGAQAIGDHQSLLSHGRRVLRVEAEDLDEIAKTP